MVDCQKHRQGLGCAGRITVILVRVKVVEAGGGGGRRGSERCKHRRVWTRERREGGRGGKIAADGRGEKKCHSVVSRVE